MAADLPEVEVHPGLGLSGRNREGEVLAGSLAFLKDRGVSVDAAQEGTAVHVAHGGRYLGRLLLRDLPRPEAREAVAELRRMGIRTILMTGDSSSEAARAKEALGLDEAEGAMLPEAKADRIRALTASGRKVAMIGDGINDLPALRAAAVGVAMGSGTDLTRERADVVLVGDDLRALPEALRLARRCLGTVWAGLWATLLVDAAGMALGASGRLAPMQAGMVHAASETLVLLNAARLLPRPGQPAQARQTP